MLDRGLVRRTTLLAVLAAMALVASACSNGEGGDGNGSGSTSGSDSESIRSSEGSVLTDSDCRRYAQAFDEVPSDAGPGNVEGLQQAADSFNEAADTVPNEVSGDFRVIADAFGQFADALNEVGLDPNDPQAMAELDEEDLQALQSATSNMSEPAVQQAASNVTTFLEQNCT